MLWLKVEVITAELVQMSNKRRPKSRPKTNDTHGGDSGFDYQDLNELHIPSNNGTQPGNRFNLTIQ